ncbi:MAG: Wadjet anti-phage system protein JetA family protein [Bacillota bacterium]
MLPKDFPYRFFNPLTSKHCEDYIHVLLAMESILEQAKRIALPRSVLLAELRRAFQRENYALDVSDEEDYDEEPSGDPEQDHLSFTLRLFLRSGWIDADESGDGASDLIFITQYGKKLTGFLRDIAKMEDQSGHVVNTYSNLQQVRTMPDNGLICIRNAYESTQQLLTNLEMMYAKIKKYYAEVLENTKPEELLAGHLYGYVRDVVDKLIFPIKVDDSVDRFKGPILNVVLDIQSDTVLLESIISAAIQTKRIVSREDGWAQILKMLNYIKYNFDDIESYIQQLDEKNQTYIRITRQKLTYMLSMDTSIKGDIIALLRDAKDRPREDWRALSACFNLFDVRQVSDGSFYHPRKRHVRNGGEELNIEEPAEITREEIGYVLP